MADLFTRFLFEAPEDEDPGPPPDMGPSDVPDSGGGPPDIPDEGEAEGPPDIPDDSGGGGGDEEDGPPDLEGEDDFGYGDEEQDSGAEGDGDNQENPGLSEKISAIMNMNLYQRYMVLLNKVTGILAMINNNSDVLYTLSNDSLEVVDRLKGLEENIRLYINNIFVNENYSRNLLFFNKCLNLLKLLNDEFDAAIRKGIKAMQ